MVWMKRMMRKRGTRLWRRDRFRGLAQNRYLFLQRSVLGFGHYGTPRDETHRNARRCTFPYTLVKLQLVRLLPPDGEADNHSKEKGKELHGKESRAAPLPPHPVHNLSSSRFPSFVPRDP